MSEVENSTAAVAEKSTSKPVNDSVTADEVDRVAVKEKTVLNGDSNHKENDKTEAINSDNSEVEGGVKKAEDAVVCGDKPSSETNGARPSNESGDVKKNTADNVEVEKTATEVADTKKVDKEPEADKETAASLDTDTKKAELDVADVETSDKKCDVKEKPSVEKENDAVAALKKEKDAEKVGEIFTDDMVEKIEQNYSPTDAGAVNLLEIADDEMFGTETKVAAETNGEASVNGGVAAAASETNGTVDEPVAAAAADTQAEIAEAANLFLQGKRNMLVKDYESAANILGEASSKYAAIYGDLGIECGEVYMAYGQALLEWWRVEDSNRKSNEGVDETKGDEDNDGIQEEAAEVKENGVDNEDAAQPEKEEAETETAAAADDDDEESMDIDKNDGDEAVASNGDAENTENAEEETIDESHAEDEIQAENNDEDEIESEEDVDNLQIAFEILEVAKRIYEKTKDDANLAKVHSKLGEISIASGNLEYAVDDLKRSLELLSTATAFDVRHKANIHFQLYIVHTMKCSFPEAEAELRVAKSLFESHLRDLELKLEAADKSKTSEVDAIVADIEEIKEVIKDMNTKMIESHKEKRELISAISDVIKTKHPISADMPSSSSAVSSTDGPSSSADGLSKFSPFKADVPINNISHLVRKKPKNVPEESTKKDAEKSSADVLVVEKSENKVEVITTKTESEADTSQELSAKRKAEDDLESNAKKVCT